MVSGSYLYHKLYKWRIRPSNITTLTFSKIICAVGYQPRNQSSPRPHLRFVLVHAAQQQGGRRFGSQSPFESEEYVTSSRELSYTVNISVPMFSPSSPCHVTPIYQSTYLDIIHHKITSCSAWSQKMTLTLRRVQVVFPSLHSALPHLQAMEGSVLIVHSEAQPLGSARWYRQQHVCVIQGLQGEPQEGCETGSCILHSPQ